MESNYKFIFHINLYLFKFVFLIPERDMNVQIFSLNKDI